MQKKIIPVIMCGGSGSRLWPLSRQSFPKQFLNLAFTEGLSLLQRTQKRTRKIKNIQELIRKWLRKDQFDLLNLDFEKIKF